MRGLIYDTWLEMVERKLIWIYVVVTVIAVLLVLGSKSMNLHIEVNGDSTDPFTGLARDVAVGALGAYCSFLVFLTVLGTAGLIPSMFVRGRAEYYLSKPLSRTSLFLSKLLSIWAVYGATIVVGALIVFSVVYLTWGFADFSLLYIFGLNLLVLFIWLSITSFAGILSGSFAVSIMLAFLVWIAQGGLRFHEELANVLDNRLITGTVSGLYYILPKTSQIGDLTDQLALNRPVDTWLPLWSSLVFALALVVVAVTLFRRKDY